MDRKCILQLFPFKSLKDNIWSTSPRIIIRKEIVAFDSQLPYTKFKGNPPVGSGVFFKFKNTQLWRLSWSRDLGLSTIVSCRHRF